MRLLRKAFRQRHTVRARALLALLKLQAKARGATIDMEIAPDFRVGRRVVFRVAPRTHNRIRIGSGSVVRDDVIITLKGGTIDWGNDIEIRRGTVINLSGTFRLEGRNIISYSNLIHCNES